MRAQKVYSTNEDCFNGCSSDLDGCFYLSIDITFAGGLSGKPNTYICSDKSPWPGPSCFLTSGCSLLCNGRCLKINDNTQCENCAVSEASMIKTGSSVPYTCNCDTDANFESGHCIYTSASCSNYCNGKCYSLGDPAQCVSCVSGKNIITTTVIFKTSCSCPANTVFKNNNCLYSTCSKLCTGMCGDENQATSCEGCKNDYNIKTLAVTYALYSCTCDSTSIEENGRCNFVAPDPCHPLCNSKCFSLNSQTLCVDCGSGVNIVKTASINAYKCDCLARTIQTGTNCLYTSCSALCIGKCGHEYLGDLCESCKIEPNIVMNPGSYGLYSCSCAPGTTEVAGHCIYISSDCSPFCDGRCYSLKDPTQCYECYLRARNIIKKPNGALAYNCYCPPNSALEFGHCVFFSSCGKYCNGKCFVQNDNTKCTEYNSDITTIGSFIPPDLFSCSEAPLVIDFDLEGKIPNRCLNYSFKSISYPSAFDITFVWKIQYIPDSNNSIPSSFYQALAQINTTNAFLVLPHFALPQGIKIEVSLAAKTASGATATKRKIYPVARNSRIYCGPCQLADRNLCESLNGICWSQYLNSSDILKNTSSECLINMAKLCYNIWLGLLEKRSKDLQCKDFFLIYNWTLMSKRPIILSVNHAGSDSIFVSIIFDMDIFNNGLDNCEAIFAMQSLEVISPNYKCRWNSSKELIITYIPTSQYITSLTFKKNVIKTNYSYAQVYLSETTINVTAPIILYRTTLYAPKISSACSPISLSFIAEPSQLIEWKYSWRISYLRGNYTTSDITKAESYFNQYISLNSGQRMIYISGNYVYPDSELRVICTAQNSINPKAYFSREAIIKIDKTAPVLSINSKTSLLDILKGAKKSTLPIYVNKGICSDSVNRLRLLEGVQVSVEESDIKLWFEIRSGKEKKNITSRGSEEIKIEEQLQSRFSSLSILSVSEKGTFKYCLYYNITAFAQYKSGLTSSMIATDSKIFILTRSVPVCHIISSGFVINPNASPEKLILKSSTSEIDYEEGDEITYFWTCESCVVLANGNNCSCEIFQTVSQRKTRDLSISKGILQSLCAYVVSLTITLSNSKYGGDATRSCYKDIKFITHPLARSGIKGTIQKGSNPDIAYLVANFDEDINNIQNLINGIAKIEWDLIGIKNLGKLTGSYSKINKYISNVFKQDFNIVIDSNILGDTNAEIPSEYIPIPVTVSKTYPPILAINRKQLACRNCEYLYAVRIIYDNGLSSVCGTISLVTPSLLKPRKFNVEPNKGNGYQTMFIFSYFPTSQSDEQKDDDDITVQFYRKDCPEDNLESKANASKYVKISLKLRHSSSFSTTLAPGLSICKYKVLIKMLITSGDETAESYTTITVEPISSNTITENLTEDQKKAKEKFLTEKMNNICSNSTVMSMFQRLNLLSLISQSGISSASVVALGIKFLGDLVKSKLSDLLNSVDPEEGAGIIENIAESLESFATQSTDAITTELANIILNTIESLIKVTISFRNTHGSEALASIVGSISGIAGVNEKKGLLSKEIFNEKIISYLNNITDLKFQEMVPGEPAFNISTQNVELSIKSQMASDLVIISNYSNETKSVNYNQVISRTEKNQTVALPSNILLTILAANSDIKLKENNTISKINIPSNLTLCTALIASSFNPFASVKENSTISVGSLRNNSLDNGAVEPSTIEKIYNDLKNTTKLDASINKNNSESKVIQMTFKFATYSPDEGQEVIPYNIAIGSLPTQSMLLVDLDTNSDSSTNEDASLANSTQIPMYYIEENKTWTNDGCYLENYTQNKSFKANDLSSITTHKHISCNTIGKKQKITPRVALAITVDIIKNVWDVIKAGNYQMLINFSSITNLDAQNSIGLIIGIGVILLVAIGGVILKRKDERALYLARIEALYAYYENPCDTEIKEKGLLAELKNFYSEIRKKGYMHPDIQKNYSKQNQPIDTPRKSLTGKDKKVNKNDLSKTKENSIIKKRRLLPKANGLTVLSKIEEKNLKDLYGTIKYESIPIYGRNWTLNFFKQDILENRVLRRKTAIYLENKTEQSQSSFCGLLITQHPLLSIIFVLSLTTPRCISLIITGMVFLGQLFTSGYFFEAADKVEISENASEFLAKAVIVAIASALLMVPLKLTIGFFLIGKIPRDTLTREEIEASEKNHPTMMIIGLILSFFWLIICGWGITMFCINFERVAMKKWLLTYFICLGNQIIIVEQCKILLRVMIGVILMKLVKSNITLTCAGAIAGKIIDKLFVLF